MRLGVEFQDIEALLLRYGIKLWGVGYWNNELFFRVKGRQAHWAQYVLLRGGVPLLHGMLDGSRAIPGCGRQAEPQSAGPRWRVRRRARLDREFARPVIQLPVL